MRYPDKVTSYSSSVISIFPSILDQLSIKKQTPKELFGIACGKKHDVREYMDALDCLYALGFITINEETGELSYVKRDSK